MAAKNFSLKLFHIGEICSALGASVIDITNKPEHYGEILRKLLVGNAQNAGFGTAEPRASEKESILKSVVSLFSRN
jgi:hypothetical protein